MNKCKECDFYHEKNKTCQSKKCCTGGDGTVTWFDKLFCTSYKHKQTTVAEQMKRMSMESKTYENFSEWLKEHDEKVRNDAIAEFVNLFKNKTHMESELVDKIVEQMKEKKQCSVQDVGKN